jgi:hypothetical protein
MASVLSPVTLAILLAAAAAAPAARSGEPFDGAQGREPVERPVKFAKPPAAVRDGEAVKITFALSAETDVAVYVEAADGRIVRHLAAGLLGPKAPEPLAPGKLEQSLVWDGKDDDGKPAAGAPFKVRVGAGLEARYAGTAFSEESGPADIGEVMGLAVGPGGRAYVLAKRWQRAWWEATAVHVFRRSGEYEKTIKPPPGNLAADRLKDIGGPKGPAGNALPVVHRVLAMSLYPTEDFPQQMAVTPDGNLHLVTVPAGYTKPAVQRLATIDSEGGVPYEEYTGGLLLDTADVGRLALAGSSDGKSVYLVGLSSRKSNFNASVANPPVVYATALPERGGLKPFFGEPGAVGAGEKNLKDPEGLAADGQGRLFIADRGNNRIVVVDEKDSKFLGSFEVPAPSWVGVHRKTGAVYVQSADALIKFSGWKDAKELGRLALPAIASREGHRGHWYLALDPESEPAVLWLGRNQGENGLLRSVEADGKFGAPEKAGCRPVRTFWNLAATQNREEVGCRVGGTLRILNEKTGKTRDINLGVSGTIRFGPNGQIYGMEHAEGIRRWDASGKPMPFPATAADPKRRGLLGNFPSGTTSWERDFCVDHAGNIYAKERGKIYHGRMRVDEYDPDGNRKRTAIWVLSDGALGPRIDPRGNLYVADSIKPQGKPFPDEFKDLLPGRAAPQQYVWMYGSVVKFGPAGGAIWFPLENPDDVYAFDGEAKLPADMKKEPVAAVSGGAVARKPGELQGALWWRYGCSYLLDMHPGHNQRCHCTACEFDIDDFGRTFYPDQGNFRVVVLDTGGNEILRIGGYGNQDFCGPESYVLDPQEKVLRPRRKDDPAELASPFAQPDVAIAFFVGLTVSDRNLYVADGLNRRVLRVKLGYKAEESVAVP